MGMRACYAVAHGTSMVVAVLGNDICCAQGPWHKEDDHAGGLNTACTDFRDDLQTADPRIAGVGVQALAN